MKVVISKEVIDDCCKLCIANCIKEGICFCDKFRYDNNKDPRVANCGDVYFVRGRGKEFVGF